MNRKTLDYYLKLKYPIAFLQTDEGYEVWYPDFGRASICALEKSLNKALKELDAARKATLEILFENGLEIPEPDADDEVFSGRFMLRVPKDLHRSLAREANRNGVSLNSYVIHLLSERKTAEVLNGWKKARRVKKKVAIGENVG